MTRSFLGFFLAALACSLGCRRDIASTVLAHAQSVEPPQQIARDVAQLARVGMGHAVVFNRLPANSEIGIILVASHTNWEELARENAAVRNVRGNCYTSPRSRTVVCDAAVFSVRPDTLLGASATEKQRVAFARWILGHELGHIATATAGYHSGPGTDGKTARDLSQQRREYAADCWMVQTLSHAMTRAEGIAFESFAIDAINAHFRRTEPDRPAGVGLIFDYNSLDPYDFNGGGSHPDTVLRSIRLLHIAAEYRHDQSLRLLMSPLVRKLVPDPLWTGQGPCGLSPRASASADSTRSRPEPPAAFPRLHEQSPHG